MSAAATPVAPHAVRRVEIEAGVAVEVRGDDAPVPARAPGARALRHVVEAPAGPLQEERVPAAHLLHPGDRDRQEDAARERHRQRRVAVQEAPLRIRPRRVEVEDAVAVEVSPRARHAVRAVLDAGLLRDVFEALSVHVAVEVLQAEVVRDEEVRPAVVVVVGEEAGEGPPRRFLDAPCRRGVAEASGAVSE